MDAGPRVSSYAWAGGREAMLRWGPEDGPVVVAALPLFEEANRTRAFVVSILRALAERGIGGVLPELPGQGESEIGTDDTTLFQMRQAIEAAVNQLDTEGRRCYAVGIRSSALLDSFGLFIGRWHLAPQQGAEVMRELLRIGKAGGAIRRDGDIYSIVGAPAPVMIAGNLISGKMAADLLSAETYAEPGVPRRTVQLSGYAGEADRIVDGPPLWRRAEPSNDLALAQTLAADIADWIASCDS